MTNLPLATTPLMTKISLFQYRPPFFQVILARLMICFLIVCLEGAKHHTLPPDLVLLSSDSVFFYVHSRRLLAASSNGFRSLLPNTPVNASQSFVITVPETAAVLNIILHAIYEMSCAEYRPDFPTLVNAGTVLSDSLASVLRHFHQSKIYQCTAYSLLLSYASEFLLSKRFSDIA